MVYPALTRGRPEKHVHVTANSNKSARIVTGSTDKLILKIGNYTRRYTLNFTMQLFFNKGCG